MSQLEIALTVDARGLACPMPVVKTKKGIDKINSGEILELLATDKGAANDTKAWVKAGGHELLDYREEDGVHKFYIKKG